MQNNAIQAIDRASIQRITSGQVVIDLQTAVKELVENSLDAHATNIEVRFKQYGLKAIEVIDNGCGIGEKDFESIALKHYTSKLSSFSDLSTVRTFGFRGEALSSLCTLCESVTVITSTEAPIGTSLEMAASGKVKKITKVARQRGTTVILSNLFQPLPVRRKEFERNVKREFGKAMTLLSAYALVPCCGGSNVANSPVRLIASNYLDTGNRTTHLRTPCSISIREAMSTLWGAKALDNIVDLNLSFLVERDKHAVKRMSSFSEYTDNPTQVAVSGLISKFAVGCGRTNTDRQFFFVNGRPCNLSKVQKTFNEVYRSFNANQSPVVVADFILPTDACDVNVSPDKRTIFVHNESNLITALRLALEETFSHSRCTYDVVGKSSQKQTTLIGDRSSSQSSASQASVTEPGDEGNEVGNQCTNTLDTPQRTGTCGFAEDTVQEIRNTQGLPQTIGFDLSQPNNTSTDIPPQVSDNARSLSLTAIDVDESSSQTAVTELSVGTSATKTSLTTYGDGDNLPRPDRSTHPPQSPRDEEMDVDKHPEPPALVLDTRGAIWNRNRPALSSVTGSEVTEPPRKKHRSETGPTPATTNPEDRSVKHPSTVGGITKPTPLSLRSKVGAGRSEDVRQSMRTRLLSFARPGSQMPVDDEANDQDQAHATNAHAKRPNALRPSKHGTEVNRPATPVDGDIQLISPPKLSAKNSIDLTNAGLEDSDDDTSAPQPVVPTPPLSEETISRPEVVRSSDGSQAVTLRVNLSRISDVWSQPDTNLGHASNVSDQHSSSKQDAFADAGISNNEDDDKAVDTLSRVIDKQDFGAMDVVGQFNLGFVIARRLKAGMQEEVVMDDLFIIDQHAADEKYNFETLQQTTVIKSQRLIKPQVLELAVGDELLAVENIDVLHQNGFEVDIVEADEDESLSSSTRRYLRLVAQPISKDTVFDIKDLEEIVHLLRDRLNGQMIRCSKARAMFAMRACRKSVMIGMPLTKAQMTLIVQHMGTMDQPWNCPHGRPTMRHLTDLASLGREGLCRPVDWSALDNI